MNKQSADHIPVPSWKRWLEFRHRALPLITFVLLLFAVGLLWDDQLGSPSLVGQVEVRRMDIRTPFSGTITNLSVELFQTVRKGEPIAMLDPGESLGPSGHQTHLLLAKKGLLQLMELSSAANAFDIQRNLLDKERLRTDLLSQKVNLASAEVQLQNLENEWKRAKELHTASLLSESAYDIAQKSYAGVLAEVTERRALIKDLGQAIHSIEHSILGSQEIEEAKLEIDRATLQRSISKLERERVVKAPADGMITAIQKRMGEVVGASDSIVTLTQSGTDTVIAYLPLGSEVPFELGEKVLIKSRTQRVRQCIGHVTQLGSSYELMPEALSKIQLFKLGGTGIPMTIKLPSNFKSIPGEMVNITLNPPPSTNKNNRLAER
jgi:multidrug resistance efflux pump